MPGIASVARSAAQSATKSSGAPLRLAARRKSVGGGGGGVCLAQHLARHRGAHVAAPSASAGIGAMPASPSASASA